MDLFENVPGISQIPLQTRVLFVNFLIVIVSLVIAWLLPLVGGDDPEGLDEVWTAFRLGILRVLLVGLVPLAFGLLVLRDGHRTWLAYGLVLAGAAMALTYGQVVVGPRGILVLVGIVVISDVAGYFAGRAFGGPKFWPKVSPKKTWSGTIAGWGGAAVVGGVFAMLTQAHVGLIGLSVAVSMASQLGDIAESAIKRRAGVKDSSNLIPGHGGLFDRFDGMLGAALFILIAGQIVGFPPGS